MVRDLLAGNTSNFTNKVEFDKSLEETDEAESSDLVLGDCEIYSVGRRHLEGITDYQTEKAIKKEGMLSPLHFCYTILSVMLTSV